MEIVDRQGYTIEHMLGSDVRGLLNCRRDCAGDGRVGIIRIAR